MTRDQMKLALEYREAFSHEAMLLPFQFDAPARGKEVSWEQGLHTALSESSWNLPLDTLGLAATSFACDFIGDKQLKTRDKERAKDMWLEYGASLKAQVVRSIASMALPSDIHTVRALDPLACHPGTVTGILCGAYPVFFTRAAPQIGSSMLAWRSLCKRHMESEGGLRESGSELASASSRLSRATFEDAAQSRLTQSMQMWIEGIYWVFGAAKRSASLAPFSDLYRPLLARARRAAAWGKDGKAGQVALDDIAADLQRKAAATEAYLDVARSRVTSTCVYVLAQVMSGSKLSLD